jgi:hypothetical protein
MSDDTTAAGSSGGEVTNNTDVNSCGADGADRGDTAAAVDFLRNWHGSHPATVVTITFHGKTTRRDFEPGDDAALGAFIDTAQGRANVYFVPNDAKPGGSKPPNKEEMRAGRTLHLDADLKDMGGDREPVLAKLRALQPPPSAIWFSGGGFQAAWRLAEPAAGADWIEQLETVNAAIARAIGAAPGCHNVNRLLRLPGTVNVLNATKRQAGRAQALAYLVEADWGRTWSFADPVPRLMEQPKAPTDGRDESRSGAAFRLGLRLVLHDAGYQEMCAGLRTDPSTAEWIKEKGEPHDERELQRIYDKAIEVRDGWHRNPKTRAIIPSSLHNAKLAMTRLEVSARYDNFAGHPLITIGDSPEVLLEDPIANRLWFKVEERFGFRPTQEFFFAFVSDMAWQNRFHPVRDYLDGLEWDGIKRIDDWLFDYGGAVKQSAGYDRYVQAVGRITLIAGVRRVRQPGCKFDEMVVLVNQTQGTNKSTALATLAVRPEWFSDSIDLGSKDRETIEQTAGVWIGEMPELRGRQNEVDRQKAFLSRQWDRARLAYGHFPVKRARSCIFFGTANETKFLRDRTGNRRFWPVVGVQFDLERLERDRNHLWAEAAVAEAAGESIRLPRELWAVAEEVQNESLIEEPWTEVIEAVLGGLEGKILSNDMWVIVGVPADRRTQGHNERMGAATRQNGWMRLERPARFPGIGIKRGYVKGDPEKTITVEHGRSYEGQEILCIKVDGRQVRVTIDGEQADEATIKKVLPGDPREETRF